MCFLLKFLHFIHIIFQDIAFTHHTEIYVHFDKINTRTIIRQMQCQINQGQGI